MAGSSDLFFHWRRRERPTVLHSEHAQDSSVLLCWTGLALVGPPRENPLLTAAWARACGCPPWASASAHPQPVAVARGFFCFFLCHDPGRVLGSVSECLARTGAVKKADGRAGVESANAGVRPGLVTVALLCSSRGLVPGREVMLYLRAGR